MPFQPHQCPLSETHKASACCPEHTYRYRSAPITTPITLDSLRTPITPTRPVLDARYSPSNRRDSWDLVLVFSPLSIRSTQATDTALGVASSLPTLALLLFTTALYLCEVQPCLPPALQSRTVMQGFALLIAPLVPIGFVGALIGSFLLVSYTARRGKIEIGFDTLGEQNIHWIIMSASGIACATYLLVTILTLQVVLFDQPSLARWRLDHPHSPRLVLVLIAIGLFIASTQLVIVLIPESFPLFLARQILTLVSRCLLTLGCWRAYKPVRAAQPRSALAWSSEKISRLRPGEKPTQSQSRKAILTTPLKLKIGAPLKTTFRRLSTEGIREFYDMLSDRQQNAPAPSLPRRAKRVVFRTRPRRAPTLSFTSSTFSDGQTITALQSIVYPVAEPIAGVQAVPDHSAVKKNYGSVYRPLRVSVDPSELSHWPPASTTSKPAVLTSRSRHVSRPSLSQPTASMRSQIPATELWTHAKADPPRRPARSLARLARPVMGIRDSAIGTPSPIAGEGSTLSDDTFGILPYPGPRRRPILGRADPSNAAIARSNSIPRKPLPPLEGYAETNEDRRSFEARVFPVSVGSIQSIDLHQFPIPQSTSRPRTRTSHDRPVSASTAFSTSSSSVKTMRTEDCVDRTSFLFMPRTMESPTQAEAEFESEEDESQDVNTHRSITSRPPLAARKSSEIILDTPLPADRLSGIVSHRTSAEQLSARQPKSSSRIMVCRSPSMFHESQWFAPNRQAVLESLQRLRRDAGITPESYHSNVRETSEELAVKPKRRGTEFI
ncbi:hypothetical protein BD324DRAFT_647999 [Kockovaella imperatae]|uniref:Uncharacterized protein n=1 Tax=Kockovaella imperatae TaxID=4999 RepID=A0A1Y1UU72_9TREE|nr:hypothetical protein BD324DRAFT_647999 [Kockovaella imperatae]ORX41104.1 hypothetical protein BD324DRAFT_647999 [Kockovaella imperatae]